MSAIQLKRAVKIIGGQKPLADAIGRDIRTVWAWINRKSVPVDACPDIERATRGAVTCEDLRSDVSWTRVPDQEWPHPGGRPLVDYSKAA